ncbi:MAG: penicillin acylase family protein, partial [Arenimonas sp.]
MSRLGRAATGLGPLARLAWHAMRHGRPRRRTVAERLANLPLDDAPLDAPVTVRWSDRHVPHVTATGERDLAVGIGVVHAHLRLAQMEVLRRIARGRLAEMVGGVALPLDHSLRVLDLARAVPAVLDAMPGPTRAWLDGFVAGVNHVVDRAPALPPEFAVLGLTREPWTAADVLAVGRLASWDVSWLVLFAGLRLAGDQDFAPVWRRLTGGAGADDALAHALGAAGHGSNAFAVAAGRSASGGALLAADPHLGLHLPSLWIAIAFDAPGFAAAGLMLPGLPFIAIGRNRHLAWGGTNLHALASELIDVTDRAASLTERTETIRVRWSRPREIRVRESPFGPVVSDAPLVPALPGRTLALRWVGHRPSGELHAMIGLNRARDVPEARRALVGFAVPGQTFVFAAADGTVARACVAHLPARPAAETVALTTP